MKNLEDFERRFQRSKVLHSNGNIEQARDSFESLLADYPKQVQVMQMLGWITAQSGRWTEAVEFLSNAIEVDVKNPHSYYILGNIMCKFESWAGGIECYSTTLSIDPYHFEAACNMGNAYLELNQPNEALVSYDLAIRINPKYSEAYSNRGNALRKIERLEEALVSYEHALSIEPEFAQAYLNRGVAFQALNRFEEAIMCYDKAIALRADYAEALTNRGTAMMALNRIQDSIASYDEAIKAHPDYADARWNKSLALLITGKFEEGWELYESRWDYEKASPKTRNFSQPLWLGEESLIGKSILLHAEQGMGDTIQFCRYVKRFKGIAGRVILEVQQPLLTLFESLEGVDEVIERGSSLPSFDYHCPLLSLPYAFKTQLHDIPNQSASYINVNYRKREQWAQKLGGKKFKRVGIVWRGNTSHKNDKNRSIALSEFINNLPSGFEYISLQKEINDDDRKMLQGSPIKSFSESIIDFCDTASICALLDLVISVDTSVAHLAAAMGKNTWLILPFAPDWRWMLDRIDSPWYRSVTLYRQGADMSYKSVLKRIREDLIDKYID